jgi:hypothetical protein
MGKKDRKREQKADEERSNQEKELKGDETANDLRPCAPNPLDPGYDVIGDFKKKLIFFAGCVAVLWLIKLVFNL